MSKTRSGTVFSSSDFTLRGCDVPDTLLLQLGTKAQPGALFAPYDCKSVRFPGFHPSSAWESPEDFNALLESAAHRRSFEDLTRSDDAEGAQLTTGPSIDGSPYVPILSITHPGVQSTTARLSPAEQRMADRKAAKRERRSSSRIAAFHAQTPYSRPTAASRPSALASAPPLPDDDKPVILFDINAMSFPRTKGGSWIGKRTAPDTTLISLCPTVEELISLGFHYIAWDGITPKVIYDSQRRGIVTLAGRPEDPKWDTVIQNAVTAMEAARDEGLKDEHIDAKDVKHRRGEFVALATGTSIGGGQKEPQNLHHKPARGRLIRRLLQNKNIRRIAGFQSSAYAAFYPKLYQYYATELDELYRHHPNLEHNFHNSIMPACTFNCGPNTCTVRHTDFGNFACGGCLITAMGPYDPKTGGHIVLYSLKLIIEFPPGSMVIIPSGAVEHGNIPVGPGERRLSFTQYAAGGLFRWVAYNFRTAKSILSEKGGKEERAGIDGGVDERWTAGINLFSKMGELEHDREMVFGKGGRK
ncbi:hypothetical protein FPV67DRAFT_1668653 [Lyophyllum atratum]|nr:hypothetical protein FPV67DRAFT_1668653 [Lyophyllum atratum]